MMFLPDIFSEIQWRENGVSIVLPDEINSCLASRFRGHQFQLPYYYCCL